MGFLRPVLAHRWQLWLLVTAALAVLVTGILVWDLTRNLRTVVIGETNRSLTNAVNELARDLVESGHSIDDPTRPELDEKLKRVFRLSEGQTSLRLK